MRYLFPLLFALTAKAQTLGQLRLVDFSQRTPATVSSVNGGVQLTTAGPHGLSTGAAVWIYQPWTAEDREIRGIGNAPSGNRGRGYFIVGVTDDAHLTLTSEMYTGRTDLSGYTVAPGDKIVPLTTYTVRDGPKVWLDGPIGKGAWSGGTTYRALEMVTSGGNSYMSIADGNLNRATSDTAWWKQVDPAKVGPGTFSASLRDTAGKASVAGTYTPLKALKSILALYDPPSASHFDYTVQGFGFTGWVGHGRALNWFMTGDPASYSRALQLATRTEDLAGGTVACNGTGYCGGRNQFDLDFERLYAAYWAPAAAMIYETLTPAQKQGFRDRLLNDNDVLHNGLEAVGQACTPETYRTGTGTITFAGNTITGVQTVTGSGFASLADLRPGSVILQDNPLRVLGRVGVVNSDTQLTMESIVPTQAVTITTPFAWRYTRPWAYGGAKTCGWTHLIKHVNSTPHMIPGQEASWLTDYGALEDDWGENNRTISGLTPFIAIALTLAQDDIRAVRLGEQAINYYMTQTLAQYYKSRMTGKDGHGTEYGAGRTENFITEIAVMLKNSLTMTPPGVTTGNYLRKILASYQHAPWLARSGWLQPWAVGYPATLKGDTGGSYLANMGKPMLYTLNLYPDDPYAGPTWEYFRTRRITSSPYWDRSFGSPVEGGGWQNISFLAVAVPFYDPLAAATPVAEKPLAAILTKSDIAECIGAGLYCVPDANSSLIFSQSGWGTKDAQVTIYGNASMPIFNEDAYGIAGNITILQNNGVPNAAYLLGGNGGGVIGLGSGATPVTGLYHANTISIYDTAKQTDLVPTRGQMHYAVMERTGSGTGYVYAMVNLTPKVRDAAGGYSAALAKNKSGFSASAGAARVQRHVIHFTGPVNHVVVYDDVATSVARQLRAYWHFQTSDTYYPPYGSTPVRHSEYLTTWDRAGRRAALTVPGVGRLSSKMLPVGGANSIALQSEDYVPPPNTFSNPLKAVTGASWNAGTATLSKDPTFNYAVLPPGSKVTVTGISPAGYNGTYTVKTATSTSVSYALPQNPGYYAAGGTVAEPAWCSYANTFSPSGSCAGMYKFPDPQSTGLPAALFPATFRAHVCASVDGSSCADTTSGEWITIHRSSTSESDELPETSQPACTATGGSCTAVEIRDTLAPKVAAMARGGALLTSVSLTTGHAGVAQYVIAGLAPGFYSVTVDGAPVPSLIPATGATADGNNSLSFLSTAGTISVQPGTPGTLSVTPATLSYDCTLTGSAPAAQIVGVSATGVALGRWTASTTAAWLRLSAQGADGPGTITATASCAGLSPGRHDGELTIESDTAGLVNSPLTRTAALTVYAAPSIVTTALANGLLGAPYEQQLGATGGRGPLLWSVESGRLCAGLSLSADGRISGTPGAPMPCSFVAGAQDQGGAMATRQLAISIDTSPLRAPAISGTAIVSGAVRIR